MADFTRLQSHLNTGSSVTPYSTMSKTMTSKQTIDPITTMTAKANTSLRTEPKTTDYVPFGGETQGVEAGIVDMEVRATAPSTQTQAVKQPAPAPTMDEVAADELSPSPAPIQSPPYVAPERVYMTSPGGGGGGGAPMPADVEASEEALMDWMAPPSSGPCWPCWVALGLGALLGGGVMYAIRR